MSGLRNRAFMDSGGYMYRFLCEGIILFRFTEEAFSWFRIVWVLFSFKKNKVVVTNIYKSVD